MDARKLLKKYNFPGDIVNKIAPIVEILPKDTKEGEKKIAFLTIELCRLIEKKIISVKEADNCFALLDLYINDNHPKLKLSDKIKDLIFEGMLLHDCGKDYGANINLMKQTAENIVKMP